MKIRLESYVKHIGKFYAYPSGYRRTYLLVYIFLLGSILSTNEVASQCGSCNTTISGPDSGTYTVTAGQKICLTATADFTGTIRLNSGELENCATNPQDFSLIFNSSFPGSKVVNNGTMIMSNYWKLSQSSTFTNYGTLKVPTLYTVNSFSIFNNYGNLISIGVSLASDGTINNYGEFNTTGSSTINVNSTLNNLVGGEFNGNKITILQNLNNAGKMNFTDELLIRSTGTFTNNGGCVTTNELTVSGSLHGTICGTITVLDASRVNNLSATITGEIAIVDQTPPDTAPFVDSNSGTIAPSVTWISCCCGSSLPSELFISEYGEPNSGNGKYLEIYNPSGASIDLSSYEIWKVTNGGIWPEQTLALTGSIASLSTIVIGNNITDVPSATIINSGMMSFNGDDPMGLAKGGMLIDVVGTDGPDPGTGFDVAGVSSGTKDNTLSRKTTVLQGNTDWSVAAGTNAANSEWIVAAYNQTDLGAHFIECNTPSADTDGDGVDDSLDNCIADANADQADLDMDGIGDVCDDDMDGDTVPNTSDCAPSDGTIYQGANCDDSDPDTIDDVIQSDCSCAGNPVVVDSDGDTINDPVDNCPSTPNTDQGDIDGDTIGDVCDNDIDGDGVDNELDCAPFDGTVSTGAGCPDSDGDTIIDFIDIDDDNDGILDIDEMAGIASTVILDWNNGGSPYFLDGSPGVNEVQTFTAEEGIEVTFTADLSNIGSAPTASTDWVSNFYLGESILNPWADFTNETESWSFDLEFDTDIASVNFMVRELDGMESVNVVGYLDGVVVTPTISTTTLEIGIIMEPDGSVTGYSVNEGAFSSSDPESQLAVSFNQKINKLRITNQSSPFYIGNPSPRRAFEILNIKGAVGGNLDSDSDGVFDHLDLDSDNDGIYDVIEAGGSDPDFDGVIGIGAITDTDNDGWSNITDPDNGGTVLIDEDTDGDLFENRIDIDSDDDGCHDVIESGFLDADGDGQLGGTVPPDVDINGKVTSN